MPLYLNVFNTRHNLPLISIIDKGKCKIIPDNPKVSNATVLAL